MTDEVLFNPSAEIDEALCALELCIQSLDNLSAAGQAISACPGNKSPLSETLIRQAMPVSVDYSEPEVGLEGIGSALATVWGGD